MNLYRGTFSISFDVYANNEDDAADNLYTQLDESITHGISAAAFALHDDIDVISRDIQFQIDWDNYRNEDK
jgi:hypothetical protein